MPTTDKRVDAYIARSAPFARPILSRLRSLVHRGCPGAVETIKWGFPHFEHHGILCSMAAFKGHCTFGFWKARLLDDPSGALAPSEEAMGQLGRIAGRDDLPSDRVLLALIRQAATLNERGVRRPRARRAGTAAAPRTPADLLRALRARPSALAAFRAFPPSHRREYVEWIVEAKRVETREKRIRTAATWLSQGKVRNWKYEKPGRTRKP